MDRAIKGNFTGLNVINKGGMPGEGSYLQMRGVKSLVADNAPLIVVNGVPYMPDVNNSSMVMGYSPSVFKAFNNQDIRNITVVKGAEAAMYGSMGSNGVIMVETDQATSTDVNTRISFSAVYGYNWNDSRIPMMNSSQYKSYLSDMGLTYYDNQELFFKDFSFLTDPNANKAYLYGYNTCLLYTSNTDAAKGTYEVEWETKGRATKWALYALMADACLWSCLLYTSSVWHCVPDCGHVRMTISLPILITNPRFS